MIGFLLVAAVVLSGLGMGVGAFAWTEDNEDAGAVAMSLTGAGLLCALAAWWLS